MLFCIFFSETVTLGKKRRVTMKEKEEDRKPISWEIKDPKPPVIRSGHLENRSQNDVM